jgi:hypothetical protein
MEAGVTVNAVRSLSHGQHPNHRANWPYFPNVRIHADHLKWYPYKTLIRVRKKKEEEESEDFQGGEASLEREQKGGTKKQKGREGKAATRATLKATENRQASIQESLEHLLGPRNPLVRQPIAEANRDP